MRRLSASFGPSARIRPLPATPTGTSSRLLLVSALVLYALTRGYILLEFEPQASDVSVYFSYACRALDLNETPYAGDLRIEFPPVAWWTMASAYLVSGDRVSVASSPTDIATARTHYMRVFRTQMCACDIVAFGFLLLILRRRAPQWLASAALLYTACTSLLAHPLYDRLDMGLLMLILAAAYCQVRAMDERARTTAWTAAACAVLGLGVSYKIIPILALPFVLLAELSGKGRWRRFITGVASAAAGIGLPLMIQYQTSGYAVFNLLGFHVQRGVQLESLYATLMSIGHLFGAPIAISLWEGGADLSGTWAPAMKTLATVLLVLFLGGLAVSCLLRLDRYDREQAYRFMCFAVAGAVILSKVLSPQYFIWALPLVLLLMIEVFGSNVLAFWLGGATLVLVAGLTTWVFPYHYFDFAVTPVGLEPPAADALLGPSGSSFAVLGVRNIAYLTCVIAIGVRLWQMRLPRLSARRRARREAGHKGAAGACEAAEASPRRREGRR